MERFKKYLINKDTLEKIQALEQKHMEYFENTPKKISNDILGSILSDFKVSKTCKLGPDLISDVELVGGYKDDHTNVLGAISFNQLQGSMLYLKEIIQNPVWCLEKLTARQGVLGKFIDIMKDQDKVKRVNNHLQIMSNYEYDMVWLYDDNDQHELSSLYSIAYFTNWITRPLNHQPIALTLYNLYRIVVSPLVGLMTPISYILVPYLVLRVKFKVQMSFMTYVRITLKSLLSNTEILGETVNKFKFVSIAFTVIFYFQSMFNTCEISRASYKICKAISRRIKSIITFVQNAKELCNLCWNAEDMIPFTEKPIKLSTSASYFENISISSVDNDDIKNNILCENFGKYLDIYKHINKDEYVNMLKASYWIDVMCNIALIATKRSKTYSMAKFIQNKSPRLDLSGFIHPCIDHEKGDAVKNNMSMGTTDGSKPCIIITGPNAGGKSTSIKSIIISIILAQTFTIVPAEHAKLTPFYFLSSQVNIPDCKGKESLFEAEMNRCKSHLDVLHDLSKLKETTDSNNAFSFIVMDEIFNSTNPIEGIAGAYAVLEKLASYDRNLAIITTHYLYLTKLCKTSRNVFKAYRMNVNINEDGSITYPYKLTPGVSRQYIALELLRLNNFDPEIIERALQVKSELLKSSTPTTTQDAKHDALKNQNNSCQDNITSEAA